MEKELAIREPMALTPAEVVENATTQAKLLMDIVEKTKCYQNISGKKYLQVEAWETIGAFNRTHAETESVTPMLRDNEVIGYQAHVQLWKDGIVVGGAIMPCYFTENCCKGKEGDAKHKSAMSAAQTFATSKAYRMNYSHVAILAGYQPLPAEEVTEDMRQPAPSHTDEEHWCKKHNTKFFKTQKMKTWAHSVRNEDGSPTLDDKGKQLWCSEKTEEPQAKTAVAEPEEKQEAPPEVIDAICKAIPQVLHPKEGESIDNPLQEAWKGLAAKLNAARDGGMIDGSNVVSKLKELGSKVMNNKPKEMYASLSEDGKVAFKEWVEEL